MNLPKSEEQVMQVLWQKQTAYMKDIIEAYPEPKPASTTISTLLTRLMAKGAVGYTQHGKVRAYHAIWKKEAYFSDHFTGVIKHFFDNSVSQFASFFTSEGQMSEEQLEELQAIVEAQIKARKK